MVSCVAPSIAATKIDVLHVQGSVGPCAVGVLLWAPSPGLPEETVAKFLLYEVYVQVLSPFSRFCKRSKLRVPGRLNLLHACQRVNIFAVDQGCHGGHVLGKRGRHVGVAHARGERLNLVAGHLDVVSIEAHAEKGLAVGIVPGPLKAIKVHVDHFRDAVHYPKAILPVKGQDTLGVRRLDAQTSLGAAGLGRVIWALVVPRGVRRALFVFKNLLDRSAKAAAFLVKGYTAQNFETARTIRVSVTVGKREATRGFESDPPVHFLPVVVEAGETAVGRARRWPRSGAVTILPSASQRTALATAFGLILRAVRVPRRYRWRTGHCCKKKQRALHHFVWFGRLV
mgnify:CR=1 FL=1